MHMKARGSTTRKENRKEFLWLPNGRGSKLFPVDGAPPLQAPQDARQLPAELGGSLMRQFGETKRQYPVPTRVRHKTRFGHSIHRLGEFINTVSSHFLSPRKDAPPY